MNDKRITLNCLYCGNAFSVGNVCDGCGRPLFSRLPIHPLTYAANAIAILSFVGLFIIAPYNSNSPGGTSDYMPAVWIIMLSCSIAIGIASRIVLYFRRSHYRGYKIAWSGILLSFLLLCGIILYFDVQDMVRMVDCTTKQRQIGIAVISYAQDHGKLPPNWRKIEMITPESLHLCPGAAHFQFAPSRHDYGYNHFVAGHPMQAEKDCEYIILTTDGGDEDHWIKDEGDIDYTRHANDGATVLFCDGHAAQRFGLDDLDRIKP